ncbi:hypothetical protein [Vibrio maritimus]|uniref:hypothetical protein n=1 Tax=Vibrio maritimus TaxID=990268 RepID=UPI001F258A69|nr:hypothetical protein [Vibrio maritimus]
MNLNKVVGDSTRLIGIAAMLSCLPVALHAKEFDFDNPQCDVKASRSVTNDHLTLNLNFCNQLTLHDGQQAKWTDSRIQPYLSASKRWLEVILAVDGVDQHSLDIDFYVVPMDNANGMAGPEAEIDVNWRLIPTEGSVFIGSHTYEPGFDQVEFNANILHEMGHVFGIGAYSMDYTRHDGQLGKVFMVRDSQAVKRFNEQYKVDYRELPISDDGGHLYDSKWSEDKKRYDKNGRPVPDMSAELMANGNLIGPVTLGMLDDLGYQVDYSKGDTYQ